MMIATICSFMLLVAEAMLVLWWLRSARSRAMAATWVLRVENAAVRLGEIAETLPEHSPQRDMLLATVRDLRAWSREDFRRETRGMQFPKELR